VLDFKLLRIHLNKKGQLSPAFFGFLDYLSNKR
jgi:hypothetical protein